MNKTTRDANEATAPAKRPTMLRRLLSHHELATMLHEAGLVETVATEAGASSIRLTPEGNAVLRGLGIR
jgi:hypothetical protein